MINFITIVYLMYQVIEYNYKLYKFSFFPYFSIFLIRKDFYFTVYALPRSIPQLLLCHLSKSAHIPCEPWSIHFPVVASQNSLSNKLSFCRSKMHCPPMFFSVFLRLKQMGRRCVRLCSSRSDRSDANNAVGQIESARSAREKGKRR